MRLPLWGTKPLCSIGAAPGFVLFPEGGSRSRFPRGDINDLRKEWPTTAPITAGQRAQNLPKSTSSGSPSSSTSARLYCRLRYWQMFCVTTLLTSCLAYRKHSRIPTGRMPASGRPEAARALESHQDRWHSRETTCSALSWIPSVRRTRSKSRRCRYPHQLASKNTKARRQSRGSTAEGSSSLGCNESREMDFTNSSQG